MAPSPLLHLILVITTTFVSAQTPIKLNNFLQPNRVTRDQYLTPPKNSNLCARTCRDGEAPKVCYYKWIAEDYVTGGPQCGTCPTRAADCDNSQCVLGDGYEKAVKTINRMVPGPSIEVCKGDRIVVDVTNMMAGKSLAIHWHGVWQKGTQYMDGVPMVTQCSIHEADTFRYEFFANNEGTHYWHSHDGFQKLDGIQGNLVIRVPPSQEPHAKLYDVDAPEHVLMVMDWMNTTADERFPGTTIRQPGQLPSSFILDGRGRAKRLPGQQNAPLYPYREIWVERGKKFRLRFVGGLCSVCGVELSIEGHSMDVIATDGAPVKPTTVNSINIFSGERYDVVLTANQAVNAYWVHMRGLNECANDDEQIYSLAVIRYVGVSDPRKTDPGYNGGFARGRILNPENATCSNTATGVCVSQLQGLIADSKKVLNTIPDFNIPLTFGFNLFDRQTLFNNGRYQRYLVAPDRNVLTSWMNNISYVSASSPILSQGLEIPDEVYCPLGRDGLAKCPASPSGENFCECVHVIKIPLNANVQIIVADLSPVFDIHHPFHLHGYDFYVVAIDQFRNGQNIGTVTNDLKRKTFTNVPAKKDTVAIPSNGYSAFRFRADNPGLWFFHCHFMYHLATGMAVVFQVGNNGDWPAIPANFPRCGNYQPTSYLENYIFP